MVTWPSGKAKVCKTFIPQFKSGRHLQKEKTRLGRVFFLRFTLALQQGTKARGEFDIFSSWLLTERANRITIKMNDAERLL